MVSIFQKRHAKKKKSSKPKQTKPVQTKPVQTKTKPIKPPIKKKGIIAQALEMIKGKISKSKSKPKSSNVLSKVVSAPVKAIKSIVKKNPISNLASKAINTGINVATKVINQKKDRQQAFYNARHSKKSSRAQKFQSRVQEISNQQMVQQYQRVAHMKNHINQYQQGLAAFTMRDFQNELAKQRAMTEEMVKQQENAFREQMEQVQHFKATKEPEKIASKSSFTQKVLSDKEKARNGQKVDSNTLVGSTYRSPMEEHHTELAKALIEREKARAPVGTYDTPKVMFSDPLVRRDALYHESMNTNQFTKFTPGDKQLFEEIAKQPQYQDFLHGNMSTLYFMPDVIERKIGEKNKSIKLKQSLLGIGKLVAELGMSALKFGLSDEKKKQLLGKIDDSINKLNVNDSVKNMLLQGEHRLAEQYLGYSSQMENKINNAQNEITKMAHIIGYNGIQTKDIEASLGTIFSQKDLKERVNLTPEDKAFLRDYLQKGIVRETVDNVKGFFKKEIKSIQGKTSEDLKRMDISDNTKFKALADLADAHAEEFDKKNLTLEQKINRLGQRYAAASLFSDEDGIVNTLLNDANLDKIHDKIKGMKDGDWRKTFMLATFGDSGEQAYAQDLLRKAGLTSYEKLAERQKLIEGEFLMSGGKTKEELEEAYNNWMLTPEADFQNELQESFRTRENSKLDELGGAYTNIAKAAADQIKAIRDTLKEQKLLEAKLNNKRDMEALQGKVLEMRDLMFKDFDQSEFKNPLEDVVRYQKADERRNKNLASLTLMFHGLGNPQPGLIEKWWNEKGHEIAGKGKTNIFRLENNKTEEAYQKNVKKLGDLTHSYIAYLQEKSQEAPLTENRDYDLPSLISTASEDLAEKVKLRNKFQMSSKVDSAYNPKSFREQNFDDKLRMAIVEEGLAEVPHNFQYVVSKLDDKEMAEMTRQGISELVDLAKTNRGQGFLADVGKAISNKDRDRREERRAMINDIHDILKMRHIKDGKYQNTVNPDFKEVLPSVFTSNISDEMVDKYNSIQDVEQRKRFAGVVGEFIRLNLRTQAYDTFEDDDEQQKYVDAYHSMYQDMPEPGAEPREFEFEDRTAKMGANRDRRGNVQYWFYDRELSPYRKIWNTGSPELPHPITEQEFRDRSIRISEPAYVNYTSPEFTYNDVKLKYDRDSNTFSMIDLRSPETNSPNTIREQHIKNKTEQVPPSIPPPEKTQEVNVDIKPDDSYRIREQRTFAISQEPPLNMEPRAPPPEPVSVEPQIQINRDNPHLVRQQAVDTLTLEPSVQSGFNFARYDETQSFLNTAMEFLH